MWRTGREREWGRERRRKEAMEEKGTGKVDTNQETNIDKCKRGRE